MTSPVYLPSGRPAPPLLTESELIEILRLDTVNVEHPADTIKRYREGGALKAVQISRRLFYRLESVLQFIETQEREVAR